MVPEGRGKNDIRHLLKNFFSRVVSWVWGPDPGVLGYREPAETPWPEQVIEEARREWLRAGSYFENVTDPDLIDHAIYSVRAAEKKYMYLLKRARQTMGNAGCTKNIPPLGISRPRE